VDYRKEGNFGGISLGDDDGDVVEMVALDGLMLPACHVIKIDVEGMEKEVLDGARQTITRFRPYLYVENDRLDKHAELISALLDLDYRMLWHMPWLYNPANFAGNSDNIFPGLASCNLICLPREAVSDSFESLDEVKSASDPHPFQR
jgi:hypothetical protein